MKTCIAAALYSLLVAGIPSAHAQLAATVSGFVTDAVTRAPIEGAMVSAGRARTRTDSSGFYKLNAPPVHLRIAVSRGGYVTPPANLEIDVAGGDSASHDFVLKAAPVISGTITDADTGERVHGCIVFATRRILSMGEAWYVSAGIPTADSRDGTFATVGLEPGEYVLEVTGCAWSWYPGVSRIEMAAPITVTEVGVDGLSIRLKRQDVRKISGVAEGGVLTVKLFRHIQDLSQQIAQVRADKTGYFEFDNVPEGELHVWTSGDADELVRVTDHDLTGVTVKPRKPPIVLSATIRAQEAGVKLPATINFEYASVFDLEPGEYWPQLSGLESKYGVAAILVNGAPLPNGSLKVDGVSPQLTFIVTSHFGAMSGAGAAPGATVMAIREPFAEFMDQTAQPRAHASDAGTFTFDKLVPGKYRIVVLTGEETLLERNEKFLRTKAAVAESVEVTADSTSRIDLK